MKRSKRWECWMAAAGLILAAVPAGTAGVTALDAATTASYVLIGTPAALQIPSNEPLTVEGWVFFRTLAGGTSGRDILYSKNNARTSPYTHMFGFGEGGQMMAYTGAAWIKPVATPVVATGQWYHVAYSYDGTNIAFYLDGSLVGATQAFTFVNNAAHTVKIGGYATGTDINGNISDVRVWDHARTQAQIAAWKGFRLVGDEPGLRAYWKLDEGTGSTAFDSTANACDGTLQSCTWAVTDLELEFPFTVAHPVTGSIRFTNTNVVDVIGFPELAGYTHYRITENDTPPESGWEPVDPAPTNHTFTHPGMASEVWLFAWYTNTSEELPLLVRSNRIVFTEAAPAPAILAQWKQPIAAGHTVTVAPEDIDNGSTTGEFESEPIGLHAWWLICENPADADATPDRPEVTFPDAAGHYWLRLVMRNMAGTVATSETACVVNALPIVQAYDSMNGYENTNLEWPEQWIPRWGPLWQIERLGGDYPPSPLITGGNGRHHQHNTVNYWVENVRENAVRVRVDFTFGTQTTVSNYGGLLGRFVPDDLATPANERLGYRLLTFNSQQRMYLQRLVGTGATTLSTSDSNVFARAVWTTLLLDIEQTTPTLTTLRAKVWPRADPEPAEWLLTATDTNPDLQNVVGAAGIYGQTSGNRYYYFQNFRADRLPFQLANAETGDDTYTRADTLRVAAFDPPLGYDVYQITETDVQPESGWLSITSPPVTATFTPAGSGTEATLYAWFTNLTEEVVVERMKDTVRYSTATPAAAAKAALAFDWVPGARVRVTAADVDDGSTGGLFGEDEIPIHTMAVSCVSPAGGDATPDEPYVTLTNAGVYTLALAVTNAAGQGATSPTTCEVTVTLATTDTADRYVVEGNAGASAPYASWSTAAPDIQTAVDAAAPGDTILVWKGVYATGGRTNAAGAIQNRVTVDQAVTVRAASTNPADTVIRGAWHGAETHNLPMTATTYNGVNATRGVYLAAGAWLEGFTVAGGATRDVTGADGRGAGVWAAAATAVISNCVIAGNIARDIGGGVFGGTLHGCTIAGNRSFGSGGGAGSAVLWDCVVEDNTAASLGGGVRDSTVYRGVVRGNREYASGAGGGGGYNSTFHNSFILGNRGGILGGGLYLGAAYNCVIAGNWTQSGAAYGGGAVNATLVNCTVTGNRSATYAGGVNLGTIQNSLVYSNSARVSGGGQYDNYFTNLTAFSHSCTEPAIDGWDPSNIAANPLFADPGQAEPMVLHVTRWTYTPGDFLPRSGSPVVGVGTNETWMFDSGDVRSLDLAGNKRVSGAVVDMGAYEVMARGTLILLR